MDEFLQGSTILSQLDAEDGAQQSGASCLPAEKGKEHVVTSLQAMTLQQLGPSANLGVALQSLRADSTNQVALESSVASRQAAVSLESELQAGVEMATVDNAMTTADVAGSYAEPTWSRYLLLPQPRPCPCASKSIRVYCVVFAVV